MALSRTLTRTLLEPDLQLVNATYRYAEVIVHVENVFSSGRHSRRCWVEREQVLALGKIYNVRVTILRETNELPA